MKELLRVNRGHVVGYGDDPFTDNAKELIKKELGNRLKYISSSQGPVQTSLDWQE